MRTLLKWTRSAFRLGGETLVVIILAAGVLVVAQAPAGGPTGPTATAGGALLTNVAQVLTGTWVFRNATAPLVIQPVGNAQGTTLTTAASATARTLTLPDATAVVATTTNPTISGQGATATLTAAQSGSTVLFDRAAGIIYTLPPPQAGLWFQFVITVSITSNNAKVITDTGTTLLLGSLFNSVAAGTGTQFIANNSTHISVVQNGTTSGGLVGTIFNFYCTDATHWAVEGTVLGSGTIVTPFSTS